MCGWLAATCILTLSNTAMLKADGTETLGPPGLTLAEGAGFAVGGVGLSDTNSGSILIDLPTNAVVQQVLLYWEGAADDQGGDADITVGGTPVTGDLIGGPTELFPGVFDSSYRADITELGLINAGSNTLDIAEVEFSMFNNGAGLVVVYSNAAPAALVLVDGNDFALEKYLSPLDTTVPQKLIFPAAKTVRTARLALLVGGSEGSSTVRLWTGRQSYTVVNELNGSSGANWDSLILDVDIPARATNLTVQVLSGDGSGVAGRSSLISWVAAVLAVPSAASSDTNFPPQITLSPTDRSYCPKRNGTSKVKVKGRVSDRDCDTLNVEWFVNDALVESETVNGSPKPQEIVLVHNFPVGTNTVYAKVSDGTVTVYSGTNNVVVRLDSEAPTVTCKPLKAKTVKPEQLASVPRVHATVYDDCTPKKQLQITQEPAPGTAVGVGTHSITVTVTDLAGNTDSCSTDFVVKEKEAKKKSKKKQKKQKKH